MRKKRSASARRKSMESRDSGIVEGSNLAAALAAENLEAGPVSNCRHVHLSLDFHKSACRGSVVETSYKNGVTTRAFWLAIIVRAFGFYVELRWLGDKSGRTFWKNFGSYEPPSDGQPDDRVYYVGYAINNQKMFKAPSSIPVPRIGWTKFIEQNLSQANVLTGDTHDLARKENESLLEKGTKVEVDDIMNIGVVRPAIVEEIRGGRLRLVYSDKGRPVKFGSEIWLSKLSPRILPRGMARILGRKIVSTETYWNSSWKELLKETYKPCIVNFAHRFVPTRLAEALETHRFEIGAKLEIVDPLLPGKICVGTVVKVLPNFWLEIRIEDAILEDGSDHVVCVHATDFELLPPGWAIDNGLGAYFDPPEGFSWAGESSKVPRELFHRHIPIHGFRPKQLYEAVGVIGTDLIYIVRIEEVREPLLLVHFEGYKADEDAFMPITSLDIFPIGFCGALRHPLQAPPSSSKSSSSRDG